MYITGIMLNTNPKKGLQNLPSSGDLEKRSDRLQ